MNRVVKFLNKYRRPQIVVTHIDDVVLVNGKPYWVRANGLHPMQVHKDRRTV